MTNFTTRILIIFLITTGFYTFTTAQDLTSFSPVANYTLQSTAEDALGNLTPIELINAPFNGAEGVFSFGGYIWGANGQDSSLIRTEHLESLYDTTFAVQLDFKLDTIDGNRPVIILGDSWRYLGLSVRHDSIFQYRFNNTLYEIPALRAEPQKWYTLTIIYSQGASIAKFYLDGNKIAEKTGALDRPDNDGSLSNTDFGAGSAFRGYWRNLKIYEGGIISSTNDYRRSVLHFSIYPNPVSDFLTIEKEGEKLLFATISDLNGKAYIRKELSENNTQIDVSTLPTGMYFVTLVSKEGSVGSREFVALRAPFP